MQSQQNVTFLSNSKTTPPNKAHTNENSNSVNNFYIRSHTAITAQ